MKALGWTLVVSAVLLHISVCDWDLSVFGWEVPKGSRSFSGDSKIMGFMHANKSFRKKEGERQGSIGGREYGYAYNTTLASILGIVLPVMMIGGGLTVVFWKQSDRDKLAGRSRKFMDSLPPETIAIILMVLLALCIVYWFS